MTTLLFWLALMTAIYCAPTAALAGLFAIWVLTDNTERESARRPAERWRQYQ